MADASGLAQYLGHSDPCAATVARRGLLECEKNASVPNAAQRGVWEAM